MDETSTITFNCKNPKCKNEFKGLIVEHKGGVNDYGWWIVKCKSCKHIFDVYVGRDVNDSSLTSGGEILDRLDREVYTEEKVKEEVEKYKAK